MKLNMTITEQVKMLDDKIKSNKAQYDLDRQAAKTTAHYLLKIWRNINI